MAQPPSAKRQKVWSDAPMLGGDDDGEHALDDPRSPLAADSSSHPSYPNLSTPSTRPWHTVHVAVQCAVSGAGVVDVRLEAFRQTRSERRVEARERRWAFLHSIRKERRTHYKQRQKERKRALQSSVVQAPADAWHPPQPALRGKHLRARVLEQSLSAPRVVIDMAYEALMVDTDVHSLAKQIRFLYADNIHAAHPLRLALTSFGPQQPTADDRDGPEDAGESDESAAPSAVSIAPSRLYECLHKNVGFQSWALTAFPDHFLRLPPSSRSAPSPSSLSPALPAPSSFVYLTAESPQLLTSLDASLTYVIGGLVDHNRLKGHCDEEARRMGVRTARLPITECMEVDGGRRTVITVNQVHQCLLHWWQLQASSAESGRGDMEEKTGDGGGWEARWCVVLSRALPARQGWKIRARWRKDEKHEAARAPQLEGELTFDGDDDGGG